MGVVGAVDKKEHIAFIQEIHRVYNLIYTEVVDSCEIREIHNSDGIEIIRFYYYPWAIMAKLYVICSIDRRIGHAGTEDKKIGEVICEVVKPNRGESVPNNRVSSVGRNTQRAIYCFKRYCRGGIGGYP